MLWLGPQKGASPQAGGGALPIAPINRMLIVDGDSRPAAGQGVTVPGTTDSRRILVSGYEFWMQAAAGNVFTLGPNFALGGDDTQEWLDNQAPALASGAGVYDPLIGVNDGTISVAQTKINYALGIQRAIDAGMIVMQNSDLPYTSVVGGAGGAGAAEHLALVAWLKSGELLAAHPGKIAYFNSFDLMLKPGTTIDFIDGDSDDGLHPYLVGHRRLGTGKAAAFSGFQWPGPHPAPLPTAAGGTINSNPMMTGTTGTKGTGTSGTVATGWGLSQNAMSPATVVGSKDTDPDGYDRQLVTIVGTPAAANCTVTLTQSSVVGSGVSLAGLVPGAKLRAVARIYFPTPAIASRFYAAGSVSIRLVGTVGGNALTVTRICGYQNAARGHIAEGYDFPNGIMSPDIDVPAGMTVNSAYLEIAAAGGAGLPMDGVFGVSRAAWRVVT